MEYIDWLCICRKSNGKLLSKSTVKKYYDGVVAVSNDMKNCGVIKKDLFDMTLEELKKAISLILKNPFFINKNETGHKMYSNALKRYKCYVCFCNGSMCLDIDE